MNKQIYDAFDSIHAEETLKQRTSNFIAQKTRRRLPARRLTAAFACLAVLLLCFGGWNYYITPVAAISVDINPSLELDVNRMDKIVSVHGINDDGVALAASVDLIYLDYTVALETLLDSAQMQPYLQDDALVSITVVGRTEQQSESMRSEIASCSYAASPHVECHSGNPEEAADAREAGLPLGKYRVFLQLQALDPSLTAEDVQGLTMRQLQDLLAQYTGTPTPNGEHGGQHRHCDD